MKIQSCFNITDYSSQEFIVIGVYTKANKENSNFEFTGSGLSKELKESFINLKGHQFTAKSNECFYMNNIQGKTILLFGLGEKSKLTKEGLRKSAAHLFKNFIKHSKDISIDLDSFAFKGNIETSASIMTESFYLTDYKFDKYKQDDLDSKKNKELLTITFDSSQKKSKAKSIEHAIDHSVVISSCINSARDLVNEPPNVLTSESYAKFVEKDVKGIKNVKIKIHGRKELKKEKMEMFLSVNDGSAYEPRLVELTYTPSKVTKNTKHITFVGKGLTFDSGGYSLKPSTSMVNMKFDMAGSATVYGAFKALAKIGCKSKVTCLLAMTDNMVNSKATVPDSIVKSKIGKTVEILNTDAEGRLVLGDTLTYGCDQKPDVIIDVATLTGACLISLGTEICGVMGNDQKIIDKILKSAKNTDEYAWQLPIIPEFKNDMKSNIADLKNIGGSRWGGTSKAAAFLEEFLTNDTSWIHLDIAGVGDSQTHLPYCPKKGASGVMIRTLIDFTQAF